MKRFSIRPKKAAKISATPSRTGKITLIDSKASEAPALGELVLLANLMSGGKYHHPGLSDQPSSHTRRFRPSSEETCSWKWTDAMKARSALEQPTSTWKLQWPLFLQTGRR